MNQREQKLLDRQLHGLYLPPHRDGTIILAILAVFIVGLFVGSLLSGPSEQMQTAANEPAMSLPSGSSPAHSTFR